MHYSDGSDSPAWTELKVSGVTQSWERTVLGIDGGLAAIASNNGSSTTTALQLANLHGDVVATASPDSAATALVSTFESDEFGNPKQSGERKYGYVGSKRRRAVLPSGVIQMGVRSYVPAMGRFTSVDPVVGGSANDYDYANQDPINSFDLDGRCPQCIGIAIVVGSRFVAKQVGKQVGRKNASKIVATSGKEAKRVTTRNGRFAKKYGFNLRTVDPHLVGRMKGTRGDGGVAPWAVNHALHRGAGVCESTGEWVFRSKYATVAVNPRTGNIITAWAKTSDAHWGRTIPADALVP
jgi:RHS repeat-associated protein